MKKTEHTDQNGYSYLIDLKVSMFDKHNKVYYPTVELINYETSKKLIRSKTPYSYTGESEPYPYIIGQNIFLCIYRLTRRPKDRRPDS